MSMLGVDDSTRKMSLDVGVANHITLGNMMAKHNITAEILNDNLYDIAIMYPASIVIFNCVF